MSLCPGGSTARPTSRAPSGTSLVRHRAPIVGATLACHTGPARTTMMFSYALDATATLSELGRFSTVGSSRYRAPSCRVLRRSGGRRLAVCQEPVVHVAPAVHARPDVVPHVLFD